MTQTNAAIAHPDFETHARGAVQDLRTALAEVLAEIGADPRRPQAVADRLGIGTTLVWRAAQLVTDEDPLSAIAHLPGAAARRTLLQSFEKAGARAESVRAVSDAMQSFDRMVEIHAGDRETLERMLLGLPGRRQAERDESLRRLAFQGNSAIWGIQTRVRLSTQVLTPALGDPEMIDLAAVSGMVGFRWLRASVPWPVFARRYVTEEGVERILPMEPIEPAPAGDEGSGNSGGVGGVGGPPLWREFCSENLPPMRRIAGSDGVMRFELFGGAAGNTGECTCINAWTDRRVMSRWRDPGRPVTEHSVWFTTPAELLVFDLFIHRSIALAGDGNRTSGAPTIRIISQLPGGPAGDQRACDLPVADTIAAYVSGPVDLTTPEAPAYPRMMSRLFAHLGRDVSEFSAYRFRFRYPPIAARAVYRFELAEKA